MRVPSVRRRRADRRVLQGGDEGAKPVAGRPGVRVEERDDLILGGEFESGVSACIDMVNIAPDVTFVGLILGSQAVVGPNTITGAGNAFLSLSLQSTAAFMDFTQPGFASALGPINQISAKDTPSNQNWSPFTLGVAPPILAQPNNLILVSVPGAVIMLPPSTAAFQGARIRFHNTSGGVAVTTVVPNGADMINGVAAPFISAGAANEDFEFTLDPPTANWVVR